MRRIACSLAVAALLLIPTWGAAQENLSVYGYFSTRLEQGINVPSWDGAQIVRETPPHEFSSPFFSLMAQSTMGERFRVYVNINGADGGGLATIRNSWGEYNGSNAFNLRIGRMYRRFGLYNEILDATPTYYGIEPPETFDTDHLIVSRTTMAMVYGRKPTPNGDFNYSVTTDNGEGGVVKNAVPVGGDVNFAVKGGRGTVGVSGYTSGGWAVSDVALGDGSPKAGVLPWMARDHFTVVNGYVEAKVDRWTVQFEAAVADHKAIRDVDAVITVVDNAGLNANQMARFLIDPAGPVDAANVNTDGAYKVQTWYTRAGYSLESKLGEFGPYLQWDYYKNPETIAKKTYGGDAEAGEADDGVFNKATLGLLYRPVSQVAFKLDGSSHLYKLHGENVHYEEIRFDVAYTFGL